MLKRKRGRPVSGGVELDVVISTERTELIALGRMRLLAGKAQVHEGLLLGIGLAGVGVRGVSGEFGRVTYRKFPTFLLGVCCVRTLLLRPDGTVRVLLKI